MKTNKLLIILLVFTAFIYSCSKDGLEGPEGATGPQGEQGATGAAGAVGAAGADGSIIYSGTGLPLLSTGKAGDYYLNRTTGQLYGPKTTTWGSPIGLMGADGKNGTNGTNGTNGSNGSNGKNGSITLSGAGTPSTRIGTIGDYYLDKTNYLLYGPKAAADWGTPILLRGAQGAQGPTGAAGKDGSIIYSGFGVPVATIGTVNDYYLNRNTGQLYGPKTSNGWGQPITLKGTDGTNGTNGQNGTDGQDGANGTNGTNGTNGKDGTNGSVTLSGNTAPAVALGRVGDYYLDKTTYQLYGPKVAAGWGIPILLRGADGAQGPAGPAGADGSVIYSGDNDPAPALGKVGDFYFGKVVKAMYGPKTTAGWGAGTSLKGSNGTNGTNGTNGSTILSGDGPPSEFGGLSKDGDFYINTATYEIYGPKLNNNWGGPTSLKGADGNANVMAFESPDAATFSWVYSGFDDFTSTNFARLRMSKGGNDTTTVFTLPQSAAVAARTGVVAVYLRYTGSNDWTPLSFTRNTGDYLQNYTYYITTTTNGAFVHISVGYIDNGNNLFINIDKIRIVVTPASTTGTLSLGKTNNRPSMQQVMEKYNLHNNSFIKLK